MQFGWALSPKRWALSTETPGRIRRNTQAPREYKDLTAKARRLSVNLRFRSGSSALDNKAVRDLDRLVDFLTKQKPDERGGVVLIGFTDAQGARAANVTLSQQRAQIIADELRRRGVQVQSVMGLGPDLPVTSNDTEEGRDKNRRVEVWLRQRL
ncbi:OmpA family protein [Azospirillum sp. B510]|uniref:OmpA family protein n=1 Tax=Azospirillum sp. (strain B510) TaxID=137722 RepID=UPI0002FE8CD3|nr:OmpA family protein [Azospirillum sp. B510]